MLGTSLAKFIEKEYQDELMGFSDLAYNTVNNNQHFGTGENRTHCFYGMTAHYTNSKLVCITLDGACGINSIERIIKDVLGLTLERKYSYNRKGQVKDVIGFYLYPNESN